MKGFLIDFPIGVQAIIALDVTKHMKWMHEFDGTFAVRKQLRSCAQSLGSSIFEFSGESDDNVSGRN